MILNKFVYGRQEMKWKSFKQACITRIYKKSDPTVIKNHQPISLLNVGYKIVSKVYADRISVFYPSFWDQCSALSRAAMSVMGLLF